MWLSYLKVALRALVRQRLYTLINIVGLAMGVTTCVLILMFVQYENSYDEFHPQADRIYRLGLQGKMGDNAFTMGVSAAPMGPTLKEEFPEVIDYVRIRNAGSPALRYQDKIFSEENWWQADSSIFNIFEIPFVLGNPQNALTQPYSVVLTERMAAKYFGAENPIGKVLNADNQSDFMVTAVVKELPPNSHWHFDFLAAMASYGDSRNTMWTNSNYFTYLLLQEGSNYRDLLAKFPDLIKKYAGPEIKQYLGITMDQFEARGDSYRLLLDPMVDIHLESHMDNEIEVNGDGKTVAIFTYIAFFILLLACINYMNLSTARSMNRAREIGIRKTLGSHRSQIMIQFLAESILVTLISFSLALLIVILVLPWFSALMNIPLELKLSDLPRIYLWVIPVGLLAGSYPAFLLSSFNPVKALRGNQSLGKGSGWLRNGLVIFQFSVSITLLIGALTIKDQLNYMQTKDLGLNPNDLIIINKTSDIGPHLKSFKNSVQQADGVLLVSNSTAVPGIQDSHNSTVFEMKNEDGEKLSLLNWFWVDHDYADVYELIMKAGRFYSRAWSTDTSAVILNEAAVRSFGISDPLGKDLFSFQGGEGDPRISFKIIGIVEDYHYEGPQVEIMPMAMLLMGEADDHNRATWGGYITVKIDSDQSNSILAHIKASWQQFAGDQALEYEHFDESYAQLFQTERQSAHIVLLFTALTIFIATIGLLGLASFTTVKRTKEIGIRKVLGASILNILVMLSKDTLKLMLVAIVIALPVAHYAMQRWLENFAYRIDPSIAVFIGAALIPMFVAVVTVVWQSFRVATANPVKSLHYE